MLGNGLAVGLALVVIAATLLILLAVLWIRARRRVARLEEELDRRSVALQEARAARESFLDLATHELRSPLSAILGYQELLADGAYGELDAPMAEAVERIGRSARHLLHLADGLVELGRIRAGTLRPDTETVDLGVLFASVADAFRTAARERGLEPHVELPPALPAIRSDRARLLRALDLLIISATKHPAGRQIDLRVTTHGDAVTARIEGSAISVHEPVDDLARRVGIRLAVADGVARVLGGDLSLEESEPGVVHALSLRVRDLGTGPDPGL